ncbi:hypothetical protein BDA96_03G080700 [Sorghum bicolor]|uniref:Transcription factor n=1 Tax=Sorghum bicolor TaxID=4558 RepID=A0A921UP44_SORBI|nr:hypothetical protein BDA96_03G080700 [Sorghum bicolor]
MDDLPPCYSPCFMSPDGNGAMDDPHFMSPFSADDHRNQNPASSEFMSSDALEKWLLGNDQDNVLDNHEDEDPHQDMSSTSLPSPAAPLAGRKRGRKPGSGSGSRAAGTTIVVTHVEAERLRRDRLNRLFCDLRAAVPTVTGMDRASLLADAVGYITKLHGRVEQLQADAEANKRTTAASLSQLPCLLFGGSGQELEVRAVHGRDAAALRLTTTVATRHAPARLMAALRALDLPVQHASVCRVGGITVQDVVVDMAAAGLWGDDCLRTVLLHKLLQESG